MFSSNNFFFHFFPFLFGEKRKEDNPLRVIIKMYEGDLKIYLFSMISKKKLLSFFLHPKRRKNHSAYFFFLLDLYCRVYTVEKKIFV